uniref:RNase H type-1 domain-containing protein n=1 Tax=Brassica oleracea TaxID=3712 RepID=A0A3P6CIV3_BRAOL|nr:unnamed protein product [Brassica oleracea]
MESILQHSSYQLFETDCKDMIAMIKKPQAWSNFEIFHIPRTHNGISDSLAKIARLFHRELCFIGCSVPV